MPESSKPSKINPKDLLRDLQTNPELQKQSVESIVLDPRLALLRQWQAGRLERTYANLLADPKDGPACRFFLSDIYAARDFSQRENDIERIHTYLSKILPPASIRLLTDSIRANRMAKQLDDQLMVVLINYFGLTDQLSQEQYCAAYRLCDNFTEREAQIDLIYALLREVAQGARLPAVGITLQLSGKPANAAGYGELHDFLKRGYHAFRGVRQPDQFAATIRDREMQILNKIYAGDPDPFL